MTRFHLQLTAPRAGSTTSLAAVAWMLSTASCSGCLGLDVTYDDAASVGAGATSSASNGGASSGSTSSASGSSTGSTGTGGGGGAGGQGGAGGSPNSSSSMGGGGSGPGGGCSCPNVEGLTDEFDVAGELDAKWTQLDGGPAQETIDGYVVDGSALTFGSAESQWFGDGPGGPFAYQTIRGDFFAWTRVRITTDGETDPTDAYHGGGLLLREPNESPGTEETFILAAVGVTEPADSSCRLGGNVDVGGLSADLYELEGDTPCSADIAICRIGGTTEVFGRVAAGDIWTPMEMAVETADEAFSDVLQIGPAVYAYDLEMDEQNEPTVGAFDFVAFEPTCGRTCAEIALAIQRE